MSEKPIVVIGGGLAGLSAAIYLQKFGRSVVVIEGSDRPGGRVATDNVDGFLCDHGFQLINTRYPELKALGVVGEIEFVPAPRSVDVVLLNSVVELGDPRSSIGSIFSSALGTWRQKAGFLAYLAKPAQPRTSVGYAMKVAGIGSLYSKVLKPFLSGVFFADPDTVDAQTGRALVQHFITGLPSIPRHGAGEVARVLASKVSDIRFSTFATHIDGLKVVTNTGTIESDGIIVATDAHDAARLLGHEIPQGWNSSTTWYFTADVAPTSSAKLRIDGEDRGPILNTMVLSNLVPELAPAGRVLIEATTLSGASEEAVRRHLQLLWKVPTSTWTLLRKYEIPRSLPAFAPGRHQIKHKIREKVFIAGDYCEEPSQNGALLSGRLAAQALAFD